MYKKVVGDYVEDELRKGKTIDQVRERLIEIGYNLQDVNEVLRSFELREADLENEEKRLQSTRTNIHVLLTIILIFAIINVAFFFYYFSSPEYILVRETPTGLVTEAITKEELRGLEQNIDTNNSSIEGLPKIT